MDRNTIRVLSLDGGGVRGIVNATFMKLFCKEADIPEDKIYDYFHIISGSSIGGIQALAYAKGKTPSHVQQLLKDNASKIFNCRSIFGGQAGILTWSNFFGGSYSSLYDPSPLEELIENEFVTDSIDSYKTDVLIPAFQHKKDNNITNIPVYFSNIPNSIVPYLSGEKELSKNVARATSAAPVYFTPAEFSGGVYFDSGLFLNNPSSLALTVERVKHPTYNRFCVLSLGTGLGSMGYIPNKISSTLQGQRENLEIIKMTMNVSMAITPEAIAAEHELIANYTLENFYDCRLQYIIDPKLNPDSSLDNPDPEFIKRLEEDATTEFYKNLAYIRNFIGHLKA